MFLVKPSHEQYLSFDICTHCSCRYPIVELQRATWLLGTLTARKSAADADVSVVAVAVTIAVALLRRCRCRACSGFSHPTPSPWSPLVLRRMLSSRSPFHSTLPARSSPAVAARCSSRSSISETTSPISVLSCCRIAGFRLSSEKFRSRSNSPLLLVLVLVLLLLLLLPLSYCRRGKQGTQQILPQGLADAVVNLTLFQVKARE